jgi:hypothetical protein
MNKLIEIQKQRKKENQPALREDEEATAKYFKREEPKENS